MRAAWAGLGLVLLLGACEGDLERLLEQAEGRPAADGATDVVEQAPAAVPAGPHLYCITNLGKTIVAFSLERQQVLAATRRYLWPDPVGPWFADGTGFYLSRVASDGSGLNALVEFHPRTLVERRRLNFPPNSNPAALLVLPGETLAWVALKGSTFDNFATDGIAVVDLANLAQVAYLDLNDPAVYPPGYTGGTLTSLLALVWDDACALGPCVYGVANNWRSGLRPGWLLVLEPTGAAAPVLRDAVPLGQSPVEGLFREPGGPLWVVNNGGFADFGGAPGSLQALDPAAFADGVAGNETLALLDAGSDPGFPPDPTGVFAVSAGTAWLTSYPDDRVVPVDLAARALAPDPALPRVTGPLVRTAAPAPALYGGLGGLGPARLGRIDPATGALLADHDLGAGAGTVGCAEYDVP